MREKQRFDRQDHSRENAEPPAVTPREARGYERKIRDRIEEDPAEKNRPGLDPADDAQRTDDEAWDPKAPQRECDRILEDERSLRDQREIDDLSHQLGPDRQERELETDAERRLREEADD